MNKDKEAGRVIEFKPREKKFRAWHRIEKKWLFGYELSNLGGFNLIGETVLSGELSNINMLLWEVIDISDFTGKKDKNGKDIYDGDIVKRIVHDMDADPDYEAVPFVAPMKEEISYIEYHSHGFWVESESFGYEGEGLWDWSHIEVIGNIFENPELLFIHDEPKEGK